MSFLRALGSLTLAAAAIGACHGSGSSYTGTCTVSLESSCTEMGSPAAPCPLTWSGSKCPAMKSCEGLLAMPAIGGGYICVFDPHTLAVEAWMVFGIDTPPWCQAGVQGLTVPLGCLEQWTQEEEDAGTDCTPETFPSPTYCCPTCTAPDAGVSAVPVLGPPSEDAATDGASE